MTQVKIENRKTRYRPNPDRCRSLVEWFIRCSRRVRPADADFWQEISVLFVGNRSMRGANQAVFGKNRPTDVISLMYAPLPGFELAGSAELLINVERAVEEGRRRARDNWDPSHELALYLAHGVDHLAGADDNVSAGRRRMRARELRWVASADRAGLVRGLLRVRA
jgi:rRNA maturation RNase YbeY